LTNEHWYPFQVVLTVSGEPVGAWFWKQVTRMKTKCYRRDN